MSQDADGPAERPETLGRRRFVQRLAAEATTMAGRAQTGGGPHPDLTPCLA